MSLSQVCAKFLNVPYLPTKNNLFGRTTPIHTINNEPTITLKKNTRTIQSKRSPMSSDSFQTNCLVFNCYFVFVNYCYYIYFQFNVVSPNWASFWMPELERERFKNDWEKLGIWNFIEPAFMLSKIQIGSYTSRSLRFFKDFMQKTVKKFSVKIQRNYTTFPSLPKIIQFNLNILIYSPPHLVFKTTIREEKN